jgi:predicted nuclease with TOPRIM domain
VELSIDLDLVFIALTLGCLVFGLQTLIDFSRQSSAIRPQLKEVDRAKAHHLEEIEKLQESLQEADADAQRLAVELQELEVKRAELETALADLRERAQKQDLTDLTFLKGSKPR